MRKKVRDNRKKEKERKKMKDNERKKSERNE